MNVPTIFNWPRPSGPAGGALTSSVRRFQPTTQGATMVLSVSGVLLLGIITFILFRKDGLKVSHMIVCMLFGFYLASTSIASSIKNSADSVAGFISGLHF